MQSPPSPPLRPVTHDVSFIMVAWRRVPRSRLATNAARELEGGGGVAVRLGVRCAQELERRRWMWQSNVVVERGGHACDGHLSSAVAPLVSGPPQALLRSLRALLASWPSTAPSLTRFGGGASLLPLAVLYDAARLRIRRGCER